MMRRTGWLLVLCALAGLHACQCTPRPAAEDAGNPDAGAPDATTPDASMPDAAVRDGSTTDAATRDGSAPDAGMLPDASGARDGSTLDAAGPVPDAAFTGDAALVTEDAGSGDAAPRLDAAMPVPDAGGAVDAGPQHVHIFISNTCETSVDPPQVTVPPDVDAYFVFHNHSVDYAADVWMSYGGGFLDLPPGGTWVDPIRHCLGPNAHQEYADISIAGGGTGACPGVRFLMDCQ